jgi:hypothetical protein
MGDDSEAAALRNYLQITRAADGKHGIVRNWEDMKHLTSGITRSRRKLRVGWAGPRGALLTESTDE